MKKLLLFTFLSTLAFSQLPPTPNLGLTNPAPHAEYSHDWYNNFATIDNLFTNISASCGLDNLSAVNWNATTKRFGCVPVSANGVSLTPSADQTITGAHALTLSDAASTFTVRGTHHVGVDLSGLSSYAQSTLGAFPNYLGESYILHPSSGSNSAFAVWDEGTFGTGAYFASYGSPFRTGIEGDAYTINNGDSGQGVYGYGQVNSGAALNIYGHYSIVTSQATAFSPGGTVTGVGADYFADATTVTVTGGGKTAAYYSKDQGSGANNYGIFFEGVTHNDLGGGVTKVGNLLDSGLSASLPVCTDGSKNLTTSGCPAGSGTVTNTGGALTANSVMLGAGSSDSKVAAADSTTTHALFATAGAPAFRAIASGDIPTLNQNTTGTASNLSGTPALPNGTTATTQAVGDNTTKLATDAFALAQFAAPPAIGNTTPGTGAFTTLSSTGQFTSTQATGTAPFSIASTTVVPNLNVSQLLGNTWAIPGTIGSTTPNTGAFTTISATGQFSGNRFDANKATTLVAGDFTIGAGWGSTASTAITLATSKDQASVTTVTTGGSSIAANPTYQLTFHDGTWTQVPACSAVQTGGNDIFADITVSARSATSYTFRWNGTPTTGKTYEITIQCIGT